LIPATNEFRISESGKLAASGEIRILRDSVRTCATITENGEMFLKQNEIYRKLRLCGYQYKGEFQALQEATQSGEARTSRFAQIVFRPQFVHCCGI